MSASLANMSTTVFRGYWLCRKVFNPIRSISTVKTCLRTDIISNGDGGGIVESTEEYKFVERLIPPTRVPTPPKHDGPAPSGWTPPSEVPSDLPYMIRRSRMHNIPVYTDIKHGSQRSTLLRKVEGDIWALEKEVKEYLQQLTGKVPQTHVNEVNMTIRVKGHFDQELKDWLLKKGF